MFHLTHPQGPLCKWKGFLGPSFRNLWAVRPSRHRHKWWWVPLCSVECPDAWVSLVAMDTVAVPHHGSCGLLQISTLRATPSWSGSMTAWSNSECSKLQVFTYCYWAPHRVPQGMREASLLEIAQLGQILTIACGNRDTAMGLPNGTGWEPLLLLSVLTPWAGHHSSRLPF